MPLTLCTAGHVDHGKSSLVRALTGTDPDRLPEEQRRGMTIELGFAWRRAPDAAEVSFIDVPGHERLVATMVAGAAGVDCALLVVAADDGPMPQTAEHLAILDLLGIARGAVALTKTDRVDAARRAAVRAELARLLAGSGLAVAPVFEVSAVTGEGLPVLAAWLEAEAAAAEARRSVEPGGLFRLAVDRVFVRPGAGVVVTGTVLAGVARTGDALAVLPRGLAARLRGIQAGGAAAEAARAGERAALNLAGPGIDAASVRRGDWVAAAGAAPPTTRIDALLRPARGAPPLPKEARALHLHLGAADVTARLALLAPPRPDGAVPARLSLDRPVMAFAGERLILRDAAARATLGGGRVVDPFPPARGRATPARLAEFAAWAEPEAAACLAALLAALPFGLAPARFSAARNLPVEAVFALADGLPHRVVVLGEGGRLLIGEQAAAALADAILATLGAGHAADRADLGRTPAELRRALAPGFPAAAPEPLLAALLHGLAAAGRLRMLGGRYLLPGHRPRLAPADARLFARVERHLVVEDLRPPRVQEVADALGLQAAEVQRTLQRAARLGLVCRIAANRYALPATVEGLAAVARRLAEAAPDRRFTAAAYRDASHIGRNLTIEVLEYLDRIGFTRREGEGRAVAGEITACLAALTGAPAGEAGEAG